MKNPIIVGYVEGNFVKEILGSIGSLGIMIILQESLGELPITYVT